MAQLVARLVRNEKVGGSNPPSSTTGRHPIRMSVFCMPGRFVAAGVPGAGGPGCGAGLLCVPVGGGPPARHPRRELRSARRLEARPGPATAHQHRGRSLRRPLTGGAWLLMCYWVRCFEARPGPAPRRVPYPQFRMQFPDTCSLSLSEKPGISMITFQSMKCAWGNCMRVFWAVGTLLPAGGAAGTREPSGPFV